jgi:diaminopimelate decarboxylase
VTAAVIYVDDPELSVTASGALRIDGIGAADLAERFGTPLHVISETRLRRNYRRFRDAFAQRWPAPVAVYFAQKSNPSLALRSTLTQEGAGGDCLGANELRAALMAGADPARLVLNGNDKTDEALALAVACGARVNVDDLDEIDRLAAVAAEAGRTVEVGIRTKPDLEAFAARGSEMMDLTVRDYAAVSKWGLDPAAAAHAVEAIRARPELRLVGLHYHLGRHFSHPDLFALVVPGMAALVGLLRDRTGWTPEALTVGGGFTQGRDPFFRKPGPGEPWPQAADCFVAPIEAFADALCGELQQALRARDLPLPVLGLEPGRFITASAGLTLTRVGTIKQGPARRWVMVDVSVAQLGMSRSPRDAHAIVVADGSARDEAVTCDVVGPLCVLDVVMEQAPLPAVGRGSLLAVLDTGGYADGEASNANSIGRPAVVLVRDGAADLIRRRETFDDVFARDEIPARLLAAGEPPPWPIGP